MAKILETKSLLLFLKKNEKLDFPNMIVAGVEEKTMIPQKSLYFNVFEAPSETSL